MKYTLFFMYMLVVQYRGQGSLEPSQLSGVIRTNRKCERFARIGLTRSKKEGFELRMIRANRFAQIALRIACATKPPNRRAQKSTEKAPLLPRGPRDQKRTFLFKRMRKPKEALIWEGAKGIHTHKGQREKALKVMNVRDSGCFQGVFRVFSGSFSPCPLWTLPIPPTQEKHSRLNFSVSV